jgi:hypothetical protein
MMDRKTGKQANAYMVSGDTGEVLAEGNFAFVEEKEVDAEQFVKVYLEGIRQHAQLSKTGAMIFELVYREMSGIAGKDNDAIVLNYVIAQRWKADMTRRTFDRGLAELLDKEFLFSSISSDTYFVNVRFMFNGDRMVLAKAYRRKGTPRQVEQQRELALNPPAIEGE